MIAVLPDRPQYLNTPNHGLALSYLKSSKSALAFS